MLVKDIKYSKGKIEIIFTESSIYISKENYIENPITKDSEIDEKKINFLLNNELKIEAKHALIKILNNKVYSENKAREYLKSKGLSFQDITTIINDLLRVGLINDEYYASIKVSVLVGKRKGKNEIRKVLKSEKIKENIIEQVIDNIDEEVYIENFNKVVEKYCKVYSKSSNKVKEKMIKNKLKEYGYEQYLIDGVKEEKDSEHELENARLHLNKLLKSNKYDLSIYENINKIKIKLVNKGFTYDIINVVIEEVL